MSEFQCLYCCKTYKQKYNYNRHVSICKFLKSSEKEQQNNIELESEPIPNAFEMFQLIKELSMENENLKKRVSKMETKDTTTNEGRPPQPSVNLPTGAPKQRLQDKQRLQTNSAYKQKTQQCELGARITYLI